MDYCRAKESFDHFVSTAKQRQRDSEAKSFGSFEVDVGLEFSCLLHRQGGGLLTLKNPAGEDMN